MSAAVSYERVRDHLQRLSLDFALAALDYVLERGQKEERLPVEVLDDLLSREIAARYERRVATNLKPPGFRRRRPWRASTSRHSRRSRRT